MKVTLEAEKQIAEILAHESNTSDLALRVGIKGAGCAGFQYEFSTDHPQEDDVIIEIASGAYKIVIDPLSIMYLSESTLDFKDDPFVKTFVLKNPNAKTTCGCGSSFSL